MRWGKIILLFQAIITLIVGIAFFSQLTTIGASDVSQLKEDFISGKNLVEDPTQAIDNIRNRFTVASYILLVIGLVEVIIIMRLMS